MSTTTTTAKTTKVQTINHRQPGPTCREIFKFVNPIVTRLEGYGFDSSLGLRIFPEQKQIV